MCDFVWFSLGDGWEVGDAMLTADDSKFNYLDPRITVAWCKKHDVPLEKIFSKTLVNKCACAVVSSPPALNKLN